MAPLPTTVEARELIMTTVPTADVVATAAARLAVATEGSALRLVRLGTRVHRRRCPEDEVQLDADIAEIFFDADTLVQAEADSSGVEVAGCDGKGGDDGHSCHTVDGGRCGGCDATTAAVGAESAQLTASVRAYARWAVAEVEAAQLEAEAEDAMQSMPDGMGAGARGGCAEARAHG